MSSSCDCEYWLLMAGCWSTIHRSLSCCSSTASQSRFLLRCRRSMFCNIPRWLWLRQHSLASPLRTYVRTDQSRTLVWDVRLFQECAPLARAARVWPTRATKPYTYYYSRLFVYDRTLSEWLFLIELERLFLLHTTLHLWSVIMRTTVDTTSNRTNVRCFTI